MGRESANLSVAQLLKKHGGSSTALPGRVGTCTRGGGQDSAQDRSCLSLVCPCGTGCCSLPTGTEQGAPPLCPRTLSPSPNEPGAVAGCQPAANHRDPAEPSEGDSSPRQSPARARRHSARSELKKIASGARCRTPCRCAPRRNPSRTSGRAGSCTARGCCAGTSRCRCFRAEPPAPPRGCCSGCWRTGPACAGCSCPAPAPSGRGRWSGCSSSGKLSSGRLAWRRRSQPLARCGCCRAAALPSSPAPRSSASRRRAGGWTTCPGAAGTRRCGKPAARAP
uniref:Uncharacterized protein n=1 Tax=Anas platyrhynchos platyrhynchos TaxID=8840 RepID=U3I2V0_ANAPP